MELVNVKPCPQASRTASRHDDIASQNFFGTVQRLNQIELFNGIALVPKWVLEFLIRGLKTYVRQNTITPLEKTQF